VSDSFAVEALSLTHRYGKRLALDQVSFNVRAGEIFGLIGPNGGGKSTIFRILATLILPTSGTAKVAGFDIRREAASVRRHLGVVFQSPGLDKKLTVMENLKHQGHLYGMSGKSLITRANHLMERMGLSDRAGDLVETLSGGLKRRLEIIRGLLHGPELLILDEPTTGLDPLVRREVWDYLKQLRANENLTCLVTTHLLEEADACDRIALLDRGKIVAFDSPSALKSSLGGDIISMRARAPVQLRDDIAARFGLEASVVEQEVRIERSSGHEFIPQLISAFPTQIESVTLGKPTLEDFFIQRTGRRFWQADGNSDESRQEGRDH